jgi:hypothetical protein
MRTSSACKANSVHAVKIMMSYALSVKQHNSVHNLLIVCYISERWVQKRLDTLKPRYDRLRESGMLTAQEIAQALRVNPKTIRIWRTHGLLQAHAYTDKGDYLYEPPGKDAPKKAQGVKFSRRVSEVRLIPESTKEVQCET